MKKLLFLAFTCLLACNGGPENVDPGFDRKAMLRNYADNLIRPAFTTLQSRVGELKAAFTTFEGAPTEANLTAIQKAWQAAYSAWQFANAYNFGPAGEAGVRKGLAEEIGTFPINTAQTKDFILAGNVSFNNFNRDTRGLLAIEYMLFYDHAVSLFKDGPYRTYLRALIDHVQSSVNRVVGEWATYANTFVEANGTDVGSSTAMLYNEFVKNYENLRNFKVGLPAGKRPGQTRAEPERVEAYASGISLAMLKLHLQAISELYEGQSRDGKDGIGLKDYLKAVTGGPELIEASEVQWKNVMIALDAVPTDKPLSVLLQNNDPSIDRLYTELQRQTRFFKSDMSSLLGIAITFSSGDGD
jgi:uncharacterized protein